MPSHQFRPEVVISCEIPVAVMVGRLGRTAVGTFVFDSADAVRELLVVGPVGWLDCISRSVALSPGLKVLKGTSNKGGVTSFTRTSSQR